MLIKAHLEWIETDGFNGCLFLRTKQEYDDVNKEISTLSIEHKEKLLNKIENDLQLFHAPESLGIQLMVILEGLTSMAQILELEEIKKISRNLLENMQGLEL